MSKDYSSADRPTWLAIFIIIAVLAAAAAALLFHLAGADAMNTLTAAGAAFVATVTLAITAWNFIARAR